MRFITHRQPAARRATRSTAPFGRLLAVIAGVSVLVVGCMGQSGPVTGQPDGGATPGAATSGAATPVTAVSGSPGMSLEPGASDPAATEVPARTPRPTGPTLPPASPLQPPPFASRVVVADLGIDLPVISGDLQPPPNYPFCDVAAYVTRFNQPYESGVTYISAHAQRGMFLPLLNASEADDGAAMLGLRADVYTNDGRRFSYTIDRVVRHAIDYAVVETIPIEQKTLILQTSEGVYGTVEKLQVLATFVEEAPVDIAEATPESSPRDCRPPELGGPSPSP